MTIMYLTVDNSISKRIDIPAGAILYFEKPPKINNGKVLIENAYTLTDERVGLLSVPVSMIREDMLDGS